MYRDDDIMRVYLCVIHIRERYIYIKDTWHETNWILHGVYVYANADVMSSSIISK
jgi:hypothetical protein